MKERKTKEKHICNYKKTCKTLDNLYPATNAFSKFKRKWREFTLISEENCRKCFFPMGTTGYIFEKERQLNQYWYMIHPYSKFREFWEWLVIFETFISILVRPFVVSQCSVKVFYSSVYQIPAFLFDLFDMTDIALGFVTGYVDRETKEFFLETHHVVLHNFKTFFFYPLFIASLPFEFSVYLFKDFTIKFPIFRYFIFLKIFRLTKSFQYWIHIGKIYNASDLAIRLILTFYNLFLILNWLTSFFYMIIFLDDFGPSNNSFSSTDPLYRHLIIFHMFTAILFFRNGLLSYLTVTSGKDMFCSSFVLIFTVILQTVSFGFFAQLYCFRKTPFIHYQEMLQETERFITQENLPKHIHEKIMKHLEFRFRCRYFREKLILETVSPPLKKEIAKFLCLYLLTSPESIFSSLPDEFASDLCLYMKYEIFIPGDEVISEGKPAGKIYFINCGSFSAYSARGTEVQHLYNGAQFGVSAFASRDIYTVTVLALEMSECYVLKYKDFMTVAVDYPEYVSVVRKAADAKISTIRHLIAKV